MNVVFALVILFSGYKAGGITTVGYYDRMKQCQQQGELLTKDFNNFYFGSQNMFHYKNMFHFKCVPVNK